MNSTVPDLTRATHYAQVAIGRPLATPLSYSIPAPLVPDVRIGSLVRVPLRRQSAEGVVVEIVEEIDFKGRIKPIEGVLTPGYTIREDVIDLARWIANYYCCTIGEAMAAASFIGLNDVSSRTETRLALTTPDHWLTVSREVGPDGKKVTPKQAQVIHALLASANEPFLPAALRDEAEVGASVVNTMIERGWLEKATEEVLRSDDYSSYVDNLEPPHELMLQQQAAVESILRPLGEGKFHTFVLHGVTGSGKTEVFVRAIEEGLRRGKTAIVLVPEIALTPQTVHVFRGRLGSLVGVYHSRMTLGQKYDLWKQIASGEVRVVIGARSAVFAPLENLGLIVVDEEHESTYKQGETPRYHARDVAVWRASKSGAVAILASATPSLESLYNAKSGKYTLLEMPERVGQHASPLMTVVDMKRQLAEAEDDSALTSISPPLRAAIQDRLDRKEQTVLLLNRRGFANQIMCLRCEKPVQCPHCDVSLTYHKPIEKLICHWCGHNEEVTKKCPKCGEDELQTLGLGTQKVEEALAEEYPTARIARVDMDTMKGRRSFIDVWQKISRHEVDIILGTQMIAKGFHLESVTLVGVISADFALFLPDFRSAERTYNLLTQVAGRAGRGDVPGEVIVQSYMPHHYAIDMAARLQGEAFYEKELHIRKMLRFPPLARLIGILVSGQDLPQVREHASRLANMLKTLARRPSSVNLQVLGPAPAPIAKLEDRHRWRILLRGPQPGPLHELLAQGQQAFEHVHQKSKVHLTIDVDPVDLL